MSVFACVYCVRVCASLATLTLIIMQGDREGEDEDEEVEEHVEQEGCPDENDFNKYVLNTHGICRDLSFISSLYPSLT